jgi:hypothetical protein
MTKLERYKQQLQALLEDAITGITDSRIHDWFCHAQSASCVRYC